MQNEIKDNEKFAENDELPVLDTPHFDDEEIAQAKPVQPLAPLSQRRTMPHAISVVAMIVAGLFVTAALAIGFVNSNSLLGSASDDASGEIATKEQSSADASQDSRQRSENETAGDSRRRNSTRRSERPLLIIRFGAGDDRRPKARLVSVIQ